MRGQVLSTLQQVENNMPGESMKEIVTEATLKLFQANMEAAIAKARDDERAHFEAEWDHRMACLAMDQEPYQQMDETGQNPKRKPEEQAEREHDYDNHDPPGGREGMNPKTPPGANPSFVIVDDSSAETVAEAAVADAAAVAAATTTTSKAAAPPGGPAVAKAKTGARTGPY